MSRVFVVNEPTQFNRETKKVERKMNLSPAEPFGKIIFLSEAGMPTLDLSPIVYQMTKLLEDFSSDDYLLPVGHPVLIGCATALAAAANYGRVRCLVWKPSRQDYSVMNLELPQVIFGQPN